MARPERNQLPANSRTLGMVRRRRRVHHDSWGLMVSEDPKHDSEGRFPVKSIHLEYNYFVAFGKKMNMSYITYLYPERFFFKFVSVYL